MDPLDFGFDPKLAAHAAGSIPLYVMAMAAAKKAKFVSPRIEMAVAFGVTAGVNLLASVSSGEPLLPSVSAAASGAILAMVGHAALTK
jgi:hypothetical protein